MQKLIETVKANVSNSSPELGHFALLLNGGVHVVIGMFGDAVTAKFDTDVVEALHEAGFSVEAINDMSRMQLSKNMRVVYYNNIDVIAKELRDAIAAAGIELQ